MATKISTQDIKDSAVVSAKLGVLTTKGDLLGYDTSHIRVPVGSDAQHLVADSTSIGGIKWATSSGLLYSLTSISAGNTISNTTGETAFASTYTLPANTLVVGDLIRIKFWGIYKTGILAPSVTFKIKFGSTVVFNTSPLASVLGLNNQGWVVEASCIVQSVGASGNTDVQGKADFSTALTTSLSALVANTAPFTIDTTSGIVVSATATWSIAASGNSITMRQMTIELMR